jgi:hypothetical protein
VRVLRLADPASRQLAARPALQIPAPLEQHPEVVRAAGVSARRPRRPPDPRAPLAAPRGRTRHQARQVAAVCKCRACGGRGCAAAERAATPIRRRRRCEPARSRRSAGADGLGCRGSAQDVALPSYPSLEVASMPRLPAGRPVAQGIGPQPLKNFRLTARSSSAAGSASRPRSWPGTRRPAVINSTFGREVLPVWLLTH